MLRRLLASILPVFWGHWLSMLGTTLTTIAGNVILIFVVVDIAGGVSNQYASAVVYLLLPLIFILGLVLVATGAWRAHRRGDSASDSTIGRATKSVMADPVARRRVRFVVIGTLLNVTLVSVVAYQGISFSNSPDFCGRLCHAPMAPEFGAYERSPHARVPCVDCHIGAGASWFVRSKLSGLGQVWAAITGSYSRPIPTPVQHLRPARETCQKCHWPQKFHGARLLVRDIFKSDEKNTRSTDVVRLNVGGVDKRRGRYVGIHWHVSPDVKIVYEALDEKRSKIGKVTVTERGRTRVFFPPQKKTDGARAKGSPDEKGARAAGGPLVPRTMDCVDCHNRPSHIFDPSPAFAVDRALSFGKIDRTLPFVRRQAIALLADTSVEPEGAAARYAGKLAAFYRRKYPQVARAKAKAIAKAGRELGWIYRRNIFPAQKVRWNTYPSHLGHRTTTEGCFRCHDDEHATKAGKKLPQDCDLCHELIAEEEEKPDVPKSLLQLGRM